MEEMPVDPVAEWAAPGEPMWQLGLESYPERPDEPDCIYYLRTGSCGYGTRCRFNHPRDRGA
ncbi:UNVERIFIED_CONTAM: Zinc finger CCCH domain-containing protein 34, partial [Sesamum indicum]